MAAPRLIMKLEVADVRRDPGDVIVATLRHPRRPLLPAATPGAHVDVHLPEGGVRHYSLCGPPSDRSAYRISVRREPESRGGSAWLHDHLAPGDTLMVSAPRNHFEMDSGAGSYILLAGGIGITPLLAMAHALAEAGKPYRLHHWARSRDTAPLRPEVEAELDPATVQFHFDDEPASRLELDALLAQPMPATQIYCCGPAGFMDAVRLAARAWAEESVRFEAFAALTDEGFVPEPFEILLQTSGAILPVPADRSALEILRDAGIALPTSCEIGVCGSCECGFRAGVPIHRDVVLSPAARSRRFIPCVSRAAGRLELDL